MTEDSIIVAGVKVVFDEDFPTLARARAEECVREWIELLPRWLVELRVFSSKSEDAAASISVFEPYRYAQIYLHPSWLRATPGDQSEYVRHEFIHSVTNPLKLVAEHIGDAFDVSNTNPALAKWIRSEIDDAVERATQDFSIAIDRLLAARGLRG